MSILQRIMISLAAVSLLLAACSGSGTPAVPAAKPTDTPPPSSSPIPPSATLAPPTDTPVPPTPTLTMVPPMTKSLDEITYQNLFRDYLGKTDAEIQAKLDDAWQHFFYGSDDYERVYYPVGDDMAYIYDVGSGDVRSEGISYGLMISVQMDKQAEFNRIWKWAKTYMYQSDGPYKGYFAWHNKITGEKLHANPASDGEEWFITALFFASARWGDGEGIFNYRQEAQAILDAMRTKTAEDNGIATDMFDPVARQVVFVPSGRNATFTDPSYHLPAYYELWARWADKDNAFWAEAANASRLFFRKAAHPQTGLMPDYAEFDGRPHGSDEHKDFRFDAWRTLSVAPAYA